MTTQKAQSFLGTAAVAVLAALSTSQAQAHQIWIEQDVQGARLCFGEFAENLREVSPGVLDKLPTKTATLLSAKGDRTLLITRTPAALALGGRASRGEALVVEEMGYPIMERTEEGKTLRKVWTPAARYVTDLAAQAPRLTLDLVPTGKAGEVQVSFRGKALPKAEVEAVAVSGWSRKGQTNAEGKVAFTLPWKGPYVFVVHHEDRTPGKRKGQAEDESYSANSFVTTLSFATQTGLASPPVPPRSPPNK